ncbi:MAG: cell division topological specificity factor MinE [Hespellia sp.]|nr:cell division topological specificity factor MinE [Hespellia sp.]
MSVRSVVIAKSRLKNLITADRIHCTPDNIQLMSTEIYQILSKYLEIKPEDFKISYTHTDIYIHYMNDRRKN